VNRRKGGDPDEFSVWHDYSNPAERGRDFTPEDALEYDRPSGARTTKEPKKKKRIGNSVRWFRDKK